jgi:SAM-dependent methyltransferase
MQKDLHEENRLSWNAATVAHNSHKGDQAAFFRTGGNQLHPEERALLGNIQGRSLVHLQCNSGQDTLSLAQLGARVVGVDISDTAIDFARQLSHDAGIPTTFVRADVYDWLREAASKQERFDTIFSSYGALCWLSDLQAWAQGMFSILVPGGRFVTIEYHPVGSLFDERMERKYPYFMHGEALTWEEGVEDYVAKSGLREAEAGVKNFQNPHRVHEFLWGIGEVISALLEAGFILTSFKEYPYTQGFRPFEQMQRAENHWYLPPHQPTIPLMFSLSAQKPLH